jgi:hypothetical protein
LPAYFYPASKFRILIRVLEELELVGFLLKGMKPIFSVDLIVGICHYVKEVTFVSSMYSNSVHELNLHGIKIELQ